MNEQVCVGTRETVNTVYFSFIKNDTEHALHTEIRTRQEKKITILFFEPATKATYLKSKFGNLREKTERTNFLANI